MNKRAEILSNLYDKFYNEEYLGNLKDKIDNSICENQDCSDIKEDEIGNYLNFFEFISSLWKLKQIELNEIKMMFRYYLNQIKKSKMIQEYIKKYEFKNLPDLLEKIESL